MLPPTIDEPFGLWGFDDWTEGPTPVEVVRGADSGGAILSGSVEGFSSAVESVF
jgi:hypothetical protein